MAAVVLACGGGIAPGAGTETQNDRDARADAGPQGAPVDPDHAALATGLYRGSSTLKFAGASSAHEEDWMRAQYVETNRLRLWGVGRCAEITTGPTASISTGGVLQGESFSCLYAFPLFDCYPMTFTLVSLSGQIDAAGSADVEVHGRLTGCDQSYAYELRFSGVRFSD